MSQVSIGKVENLRDLATAMEAHFEQLQVVCRTRINFAEEQYESALFEHNKSNSFYEEATEAEVTAQEELFQAEQAFADAQEVFNSAEQNLFQAEQEFNEASDCLDDAESELNI